MNIFFLSWFPEDCAKQHCDKHVVKMIVETAQLLSTAHQINGVRRTDMYKPTHVNHPCAKWVRERADNYSWTYKLLKFLCEEYTFRYGKIHKTESLLKVLRDNPVISPRGMTLPAQAMPDQYRNPSPVRAYRNYYIEEKKKFAKWTNREVPEWFNVDRWPSG